MEYKLFNFQGSPVIFRLWFLLLFLLLPLVMVIGVFISVLVHEMAHAYMANKLSYQVGDILIDVFGGGTAVNLNHIPERDSIKIIAAGPLSNLVLFILASLFPQSICFGFFEKLAFVNLFLFIFNILPIRPMDGGLILRDILLSKMRSNRRKSIKISNYVSLGTSIGLLIFSEISGNMFMAIFACVFIYYSLKELGFIKL